MTDTSSSPFYQAAVVGGGPAGLATAIALAQAGVNVALVARRSPYADNRTTALLGGSVDFLQSLDVWNRCSHFVTDRSAVLRVSEQKRQTEPGSWAISQPVHSLYQEPPYLWTSA